MERKKKDISGFTLFIILLLTFLLAHAISKNDNTPPEDRVHCRKFGWMTECD